MTKLASTLLLSAMIVGCADRNLGDGPDTAPSSGEGAASSVGDTSAGTPTGGPSSSSGAESDPSAGDSGLGFLPAPDSGSSQTCDVFKQDCPTHEKCVGWASEGGDSWNATKCVDVTGDQLPGEPCVAKGGGLSGEDDCTKWAMCWNVGEDDVGVCVELCKGNQLTPICAPDTYCRVSAEGVLNLCLPQCDPLSQNCSKGDLCLVVTGTSQCVPDASGDEGQDFDPCEYANACDLGLMCAEPTAASECDPSALGCCTPLCSLSGPSWCPGVGQECSPAYAEGEAPPDLVDVGYCKVPM